MNKKTDMIINIYGGNNLIVSGESPAIQDVYGDMVDEFADRLKDSEEMKDVKQDIKKKSAEDLPGPVYGNFRASYYMPDVEVLSSYKVLLAECTTAHELALVVEKMLADENCKHVNKHTVVKAVFIQTLLPFAEQLVSGTTVSNIRAQINNMLTGK